MSELPSGSRTVKEYRTYFKFEGDKSYWTSGTYNTIKDAMDDINKRKGIIDWKIIRVKITYDYSIARKSK